MSEKLEWIYPFKTIIYSRDELHRNHLSSPITVKDDNSIICLRNIDNDEVIGYLKFTVDSNIASMNEIESIKESIFTKFEKALLLKGFILKKTHFEEPKCMNCQGRTFSVNSTLTAKYKIEGETRTILESDSQQIDKFFNEMESNQELLKMANDISGQEKLDEHKRNFMWYWISFNRIFNPSQKKRNDKDLIVNYVDSLSPLKINALINRNKRLFVLLSQFSIIGKEGKPLKVSDELREAIKKGNKKDIVKKSTECVYQLRNELFHSGKLTFNDIAKLTNFVFDLVYLDQIMKFGEKVVTSFYDV